jgi:CDP-glucose 4,6-dehydratase
MENMVNFQKLKETYSQKKIFITGHTGFKGSWLLKTLSLLGADIKGYALAPHTSNDLFNLINGEEICNSVIADIRDKEKLENEILNFQPDFIFHLAAQPLVRLSYEIPTETFEVNVIGTANLLDSVKLLNKKCTVVIITTDKVYYNHEWVYPYRETDRLGGYDPYSASKACTELLVDSYRNSFFNKNYYEKHLKAIAVARAGNVIGGGDWSADRLIPDIVRSLYENKPILIRNPGAIRPWQHVIDPINGYLLLGLKLENNPLRFSEAFNFGPESDDTFSVAEMVELAIKQWGGGDFQIEMNDNQPHEAGILKLDINKAKTELDWKPLMNAENAIMSTIMWYNKFKSDFNKIDSFTTQFIKTSFNYEN